MLIMNKKDIKNILMSMRNAENEAEVNKLLGEIDIMQEDTIEQICIKIGNDEEKLRRFLEEKLTKNHSRSNEKFLINRMFTYGTTANCVHLHLPIDLHETLLQYGFSKTMNLVNLYLLDAITKIKELKDSGFYRLQEKDTIYMISPAMIKREMQFLEKLDFTTNSYKKNQLKDENFVRNNSEAQLAVSIFGNNSNIGTASIQFNKIDSKEWQEKKEKIIRELKDKGIAMSEEKDTQK